jgi:hypothetical protein
VVTASLALSIPDWADSDNLATAAQIVSAAVTAALFYLAYGQLKAIAVERSDRWKPVIALDVGWGLEHTNVEIKATNLGPGPALEVRLQGTSLHEEVTYPRGSTDYCATLAVGEAMGFRFRADQLGVYLSEESPEEPVLSLAKFRVDYLDSLGQSFESTAVMVHISEPNFPWELREVRAGIALSPTAHSRARRFWGLREADRT